MIIYKITNLVNEKIYIGKTSTSFEERWKKHLKHAFKENRKTRLHNAIRKHGAESFIIEQIDSASSESDLNNLEKRYIEKLDSRNPLVGYNISIGGDGGNLSQEHYDKLANMKRGKSYEEMYGTTKAAEIRNKKKLSTQNIQWNHKPLSEEEKLKRSIDGKMRWKDPIYREQHTEINKAKAKNGIDHHFYGKTHTEEAKARISSARLGKTYEDLFGKEKSEVMKELHRQHMILNNPSKKYINLREVLLMLINQPRITLDIISKKIGVCRVTLSCKLRKLLKIENFRQFRQSKTDQELKKFFEEHL